MTLNFKPTLMRHRVTFQSKTRTQDSEGLESITWADVTNATSIPASVIPLSGKEIITSQQVNANYKARVTIYKNTNIDESMRMSFNSQYYSITDILPDPTNEIYYTLMVVKYG